MDWKDEAQAVWTDQDGGKVHGYDWDWAAADANREVDTKLDADDAIVIRFEATPPANNARAQISITTMPKGVEDRMITATISTTPCDMSPDQRAAPKTFYKAQTPKVYFVVGKSPVVMGTPTSASLTPGVTYYLNVTGGGSEVRVQLQKPRGH